MLISACVHVVPRFYVHAMHIGCSNMHVVWFVCCSSEQNFLDWYFRYDSFNLPFSYHANAHQHPDLRSHGTVTGLQPILLHFADKKPWEVPSNDTLSKYANPCSEAFPVTIAPPSPSKGYALPRLRKHVNRHHRRRAGEDASGCVEHRIIDAR